MKWIFELSKYLLQFSIDQCRFSARLRQNKQITFPNAVLKVVKKEISNSLGYDINLVDLINSDFVFEMKAVRFKGVWYRVSTEVENKR